MTSGASDGQAGGVQRPVSGPYARRIRTGEPQTDDAPTATSPAGSGREGLRHRVPEAGREAVSQSRRAGEQRHRVPEAGDEAVPQSRRAGEQRHQVPEAGDEAVSQGRRAGEQRHRVSEAGDEAVPQSRRAGETGAWLQQRALEAGRGAGLAAVGVAPVEVFESTRRILHERKTVGLHGGMQFTYRNPERSTDPGRILPGAASLVVGALSYARPAGPEPAGGRPMARVARYASGDVYGELRSALGVVAGVLIEAGHRAVVVADDNALVDREAARRAGLGYYGKNSNLLLANSGSWFVLGTVVTDAVLPPTVEQVPDGCGPCRRCLDGCPTGAIIAPGVVDARRCLAWLLQATGDFPEEFRTALGDRLYGCDDCQEVCPPNRRVPEADDPGPQASVDVLDLLAADDEELMERHGRWYIPDRDPRYLRRNALVVLGNIADGGDPEVIRTVRRYQRHPDGMLARHAAWAARRLGLDGEVETPAAGIGVPGQDIPAPAAAPLREATPLAAALLMDSGLRRNDRGKRRNDGGRRRNVDHRGAGRRGTAAGAISPDALDDGRGRPHPDSRNDERGEVPRGQSQPDEVPRGRPHPDSRNDERSEVPRGRPHPDSRDDERGEVRRGRPHPDSRNDERGEVRRGRPQPGEVPRGRPHPDSRNDERSEVPRGRPHPDSRNDERGEVPRGRPHPDSRNDERGDGPRGRLLP